MSTRGGQSTGKWVSRRVLQQQQHAPSATGKVIEDGAIAAARIRESESMHSTEVEVPVATSFEVQEATDALSNLYHNTEYVTYTLQNDPCYQPEQDGSTFHEHFLKQLEVARP